MFNSIRPLFVPLALAAGLSTTLAACNESSGALQPGYVNTSAPAGPGGGYSYRGESGRVVSIRDANIRGGRQSGVSDGTLVGGGVGLAGGAAIGAAVSNSVGGAVVGGLIGAIGGAVAGTAIDQNSTRRGIEVVVQRDDGQTATIAQRDDGDVQMGDRVQIVYDRNGVAKAVRDTGYRRD